MRKNVSNTGLAGLVSPENAGFLPLSKHHNLTVGSVGYPGPQVRKSAVNLLFLENGAGKPANYSNLLWQSGISTKNCRGAISRGSNGKN